MRQPRAPLVHRHLCSLTRSLVRRSLRRIYSSIFCIPGPAICYLIGILRSRWTCRGSLCASRKRLKPPATSTHRPWGFAHQHPVSDVARPRPENSPLSDISLSRLHYCPPKAQRAVCMLTILPTGPCIVRLGRAHPRVEAWACAPLLNCSYINGTRDIRPLPYPYCHASNPTTYKPPRPCRKTALTQPYFEDLDFLWCCRFFLSLDGPRR